MLEGKAALVTGSTSGIGLSIARALAAQGCRVMLNGFGEASAIETERAALERAHGVKVDYSGADVARATEAHDLVAAARRSLGGLDILVNNAGIQHVAPVDEFPLEKWDQIIAVNLTAAFHTVRAALPGMRAKGWGRIINMGSAHGLVASPFKSAYVAAKHGLLGLTKTVALETAGQGITCNAICPGYVLTPLVDKQIDDQARVHGIPRDQVIAKVILERQPSRTFVRAEEIAAFTVFLCSDAAASITGSAQTMDGGWTAQ